MKSAAAMGKLGAKATVSNRRLDGTWVKTMVLTSPMRRASQAAPKWEAAFIARAAKKSRPSVPAPASKRSRKKSARSAVVRKPPPRLSRAKRLEMRQRTRLVSGTNEILGREGTSTAGESQE